jgi:OOP family OmpA-OmpF porin
MRHPTSFIPRRWLATAVLAVLGSGTTLAAEMAPLQKVTVRAVAHFDFDSTTMAAQDQQRLLAEVGTMKDVTWQTVTATGHTDSVGPPGYNATLAQRRASAVKAYLTGQGLPATLVRTAAMGEVAPVADNTTEQGRAQNRRTEVVFEGVRAVAR